ncbi:MAG: PDZ domain-containing protein [Acidimicrobiales bacterium]|nr:PDZ domain-containing protein [Acidimicrobiales bacterium]
MNNDGVIETPEQTGGIDSVPPVPRSKLRPVYILITTGAVFLILAAGLFIYFAPASWVSDDSYILSPGSATNTANAIFVDGTDSFPPEGEIAYTTVSITRKVTLLDWIRAKRDATKDLINPAIIDGGRTVGETRQVTQFQMEQSQSTAELVALNFLGYAIVPEIEGAFVTRLVEESPAEEFLQLGDLIVEVNKKKVRSADDLGDQIKAREPGESVEIKFLRSSASLGGSGADEDAVSLTSEITLSEHPEIDDTGFLGVVIETPIRADAPFEITIDVGSVRGPSAGLAFALSILDVITEGELTGGIRIATTGTIDRFGNVGPVGGVPQKTEAAVRSGIKLFLVPPGEFAIATEIANGRISVRCVQTFSDAILVLEEFGGNGVDIAERNGLPPLEFSKDLIDEEDGVLTCAEAQMPKSG